MTDDRELLCAKSVAERDNVGQQMVQRIGVDAAGLELRLYPRWAGATT